MNILLTFDNGYAPHAAVVIESIILNSFQKHSFYILYNELTEDNQQILYKHYKEKVNKLCFIKVEDQEFLGADKLSTLQHIINQKSALLRLLVEKVPCNDWILYLDCDVIVQDDVSKLEMYYDSTKILGAVTEYNAAYKLRDLSKLTKYEYPTFVEPLQYEAYWYRTLQNLGMNIGGKYFCSGVMLINLKLWRENEIGEKILSFIRDNSTVCFAVDQDALNYQFNGDYIELPPRWGNNVVLDAVFTNYSSADLEEAVCNPAIIHIAGSIKPWMYRCSSKYKKLYYKYRKNTPWPKLIYPDKNMTNIIRGYADIFRKLFAKVVSEKMKHTVLFFIRYEKKCYFSSIRIK